MNNSEHISNEAIELYRERKTAPAETLAVQNHISVCETCRAKLAQNFNAEKAFVALRNDFAFDEFSGEPKHLPYEQLALFVDGKLDEVDQEIAESHLFVCAECAKDAADLRSYQTIANAPTIGTKSAKTKSFWQKLFAFGAIGSFAPVAAILLVAVLFGAWFLIRFNRTREITRTNTNQMIFTPSPAASLSPLSNTENINSAPNTETNQNDAPPITPSAPLLALNDGQITIDENNNVNGLENLSPAAQKAVRQSLQTGIVSVSPAANSLGGNGGILMGGGNESNGVPFALQTPIGRIIKDAQPVLRWKALKDAIDYSVAIVDDKFRVVAESGKLNGTSWKPSKPLPRGANYSWQVTATRADGTETTSPSSPAPQAKFRVLDQAALNEINRLENFAAKSHLALGILYAQNGLKTEARREFEILVKQNPKSIFARKLLGSVR